MKTETKNLIIIYSDNNCLWHAKCPSFPQLAAKGNSPQSALINFKMALNQETVSMEAFKKLRALVKKDTKHEEKSIFEKANSVFNWNAKEIFYEDHPDIRCIINNEKVGIELTEIMGEEDVVEIVNNRAGRNSTTQTICKLDDFEKIKITLSKKMNKNYSVQDYKIWLICYVNRGSFDMEWFLRFSDLSELKYWISGSFLNYAPSIDRVLICAPMRNNSVFAVDRNEKNDF